MFYFMTIVDGHEARRLKTREQILEAAKQQFAAKGYANTSIADIVKAANVGRRTFYLHFSDKEAVLNELADRAVQHVLTITREKTDGQDLYNTLGTAMHEILMWVDEHRPMARVLMGTEGTPNLIHRIHDAMRAAFLGEMTKCGTENPGTVFTFPFLAAAITGMIAEVIHVWLQEEEPNDPETLTQQIMTLLFDSIANHLTIE